MQCPRCNTEVPEPGRTCPVCHKALTPQNLEAMRVTLTGEVVEARSSASVIPPADEVAPGGSAALPSPARKINTANPALRAALAPPVIPSDNDRGRREWRMLLPLFALAGSLAALLLLLYPPHRAWVPTLFNEAYPPHPRPALGIHPIFFWLLGAYVLLSITLRRAMPAPWILGRWAKNNAAPSLSRGTPGELRAMRRMMQPNLRLLNMRINWVLTGASLFCYLAFPVINDMQSYLSWSEEKIQRDYRHHIWAYHQFQSHEVTEAQARQILMDNWRRREIVLYRGLAVAAMVSYLAAAGYSLWWLRVRPEEEAPITYESLATGWQAT